MGRKKKVGTTPEATGRWNRFTQVYNFLNDRASIIQAEVGEICGGMKPSAISNIVRRQNHVQLKHLLELEEKLGVSSEWVMSGEGAMFLPDRLQQIIENKSLPEVLSPDKQDQLYEAYVEVLENPEPRPDVSIDDDGFIVMEDSDSRKDSNGASQEITPYVEMAKVQVPLFHENDSPEQTDAEMMRLVTEYSRNKTNSIPVISYLNTEFFVRLYAQAKTPEVLKYVPHEVHQFPWALLDDTMCFEIHDPGMETMYSAGAMYFARPRNRDQWKYLITGRDKLYLVMYNGQFVPRYLERLVDHPDCFLLLAKSDGIQEQKVQLDEIDSIWEVNYLALST